MSSKAKNNLLKQLYQSLDSDSEDEDYVCKEDENSCNDEDDNESSSNEEEEEEEDEEEEEEEEENEEVEEFKEENSIDVIEIDDGTKTDSSNVIEIKEVKKIPIKKKSFTSTSSNQNLLKNKKTKNISICCICLNENSDYTDELVECDLCGLYVHEGCYGISDTDSKMSTNSSASTEPWFCNACLLDTKSPQCDLCPNKDGIFKETEAGRLVHAICALYTPNCAYQDTDKLWPVVLDEIPFVKWGEQICMLCDDVRFSRTGVCIQCDAGLCRNYFHVTCAQKHGLLVDPLQQNNQHADDPYIAYCKQHQDKSQINLRKKNYLVMISNHNEKKAYNEAIMKSDTSDKERLLRKLKKAKQLYNEHRIKRPRPLSPKTKIPRMITTCPSGLKSLINKAELLGARTDYRIDQQHRNGSVTFSIDFVNYYFEREKKIPELYEEHNKLKEQQEKLKAEELDLKNNYEEKIKDHDKIVKSHEELEKILNCYVYIIENYSKTNNLNINSKILINDEESSICDASIISENKSLSQSFNNKQTTVESLDIIKLNTCSICKESNNMHLMIDCDTCKNYYHINCLDPPLTTVPKKTKLYGWECSSCGKDDLSSENNEKIDVNTPRALRTCDRREEKKIFNTIGKYSNKINFDEINKSKNTKKKPKVTKKRSKTLDNIPKRKSKISKNNENTNNQTESLTVNETVSEKQTFKRVKSTSSLSSVLCTTLKQNDDLSINNNKQNKKFKYFDTSSSSSSTSPDNSILSKTVPFSRPIRKSDINSETLISNCSICNEITVNNKKLTVKCGECNNLYHIKCLNEPIKQYKGYVWICDNCQSDTEEEDEEEGEEENKNKSIIDDNESIELETVNNSKLQKSISSETNKSLIEQNNTPKASKRTIKKLNS